MTITDTDTTTGHPAAGAPDETNGVPTAKLFGTIAKMTDNADLAACITAGIAAGAAARNIELRSVSSTVSGDIDVRGVLGIDPDVRKGFSSVGIDFDIDADASADVIDALVASASKYAAVFDMLANPTSVSVTRRNGAISGGV